ncbi:sensor histidine kinase [Solilutibacter silvestris]|uniref:histidine kinase n=1 Tax=Solilutibacter silvestris TaxID=1645665 RepID=A0A2K1Q2N8_9GAMM|nr:HAMP domain-containing sensor histidine kinase [Lysobacter silvestris]PNS09316.1 Histidine kinase-, DNA gyrase B-, and HSP90-like ATPase [Lysobacter silvestris]
MPPTRSIQRFADSTVQRELRAYAIYRSFAAAMIAAMAMGIGGHWLGDIDNAGLIAWICCAYLGCALVLLLLTRSRLRVAPQIALGTLLDVFFANAAINVIPQATPVIAIMLILNVAAASLLLSLMFGLITAALATLTFLAPLIWRELFGEAWDHPWIEPLIFGASYFAIAWLTHVMGQRMVRGETEASRRGEEVADLAALNELIIRRMPTGVVIVERDGLIRLANEAALALLGEAGDGHRPIGLASPELAQRLRDWQGDGAINLQPMRMGTDQAEILPQFLRLHAGGDEVLVFLDDTSQASRRAEGITLAALGRFSASLAHEIRNPLSAISYSTQLLEESDDLTAMDRKMLEIVRQQTTRMNGIVESVLSMARRERANPQAIDLRSVTEEFAEEYRRSYPLDADTLEVVVPKDEAPALADPKHVHQILLVLVSNARYYGRMPGEPARITLCVRHEAHQPAIDVMDTGPGIAEADERNLFRPFFTTSEHGTGLGLHIARELAHANQGELSYLRLPFGSCFRLRLPGATAAANHDAGVALN